MGEIQELKLILREDISPFFTDEELYYYLNKNDKDINKRLISAPVAKILLYLTTNR